MKKLIFAAIFLSGCAFVPAKQAKLYTGPEKSENELSALAFMWRPTNSGGLFIISGVDGKKFNSNAHVSAIMLTPGTHKIDVLLRRNQLVGARTLEVTTAEGSVTFNFEPGKKYAITGTLQSGLIIFKPVVFSSEYPISCMNSVRWDPRRDTSSIFSHCSDFSSADVSLILE
jgi:hypothetical protein